MPRDDERFKDLLFREFFDRHGPRIVQQILRAASESITEGGEGAFLVDDLDQVVLSVSRDLVTFQSVVGQSSIGVERARELAGAFRRAGDLMT